MINHLLNYIAPHHCSGCSEMGTLLCDNCKYDITSEMNERCIVCLAPSRKGLCLQHHVSYKKAWFVGERKDTLQRLIGSFKFQNAKSAGKKLAELLDASLPHFDQDTIVVPIPTAPSHIRERGYDHALLIAQYFAQKRNLSLNTKLIVRENVKTQHSATRAERIKQATSAFRLNTVPDATKNYLVIDDVVTTGSTIEAASRLLARGGAKSVWVGAIARQPLD